MNLSNLAHEGQKRITRRESFLADMERLVPFAGWVGLIEPYCYVKRATAEADLK